MFGLFSRANQKLSLTPAERAILRLVEGLVVTFLIAGVQAGMQFTSAGAVDWLATLHTAVAVGIGAALLALKKYGSAHLDPPLSQTLISGIATVEKANDIKEPVSAPDFANNPLPAGIPPVPGTK